MHTPPQFDLDPQQRGLHALANRMPKHQKPSLLRLPADVLEAKEIEGLRFTQTGALSVRRRVASELDQPRFVRVQLQLELLHSFFQFRPEPFGIVLELESNQGIIGITHHDHIAMRTLLTPGLNPEIEDVMEVDIRQQRRCTSALRRTRFHLRSLALFQYACVQPFLDETHHAPVRYPMLEKPDQPLVRQTVEKAAHVQVQHPVHTTLMESAPQRIQRFMLAALGPEAIREAEEVGLCSETSPALWVCPISRVRSSSAPVLKLPDASRER